MADAPINESAAVELVGWRNRRGQFAKLAPALIAAMADAAKASMGDLKDAAIALSPEGSHPFGTPDGYVKFKDSWETSFEGSDTGGTAQLWNKSDHAGYVMFDTREHPVDATHAEALRFESADGDIVFRKHVTIPAHTGNNVLEKTLEQNKDKLQNELQKVAGTVSVAFHHVFES